MTWIIKRLAAVRAGRHERQCPVCHGTDGSHTAPDCPGGAY